MVVQVYDKKISIMEALFISDEYNNFEYGATFECGMINWRTGEEKCCGLVSAALLPTAGLNVNTPDRGVCMSWVLGPGPGPAMCRDSHP